MLYTVAPTLTILSSAFTPVSNTADTLGIITGVVIDLFKRVLSQQMVLLTRGIVSSTRTCDFRQDESLTS